MQSGSTEASPPPPVAAVAEEKEKEKKSVLGNISFAPIVFSEDKPMVEELPVYAESTLAFKNSHGDNLPSISAMAQRELDAKLSAYDR
jgi:hypothetical protein